MIRSQKQIPHITEYSNRLQEILAIAPESVDTKDSAKIFVNKICDWVNFLESDKYYSKLVTDLYQNEGLVGSERDMVEKAQAVVDHIEVLFDQASAYIEDQQMVLPTWDEVINKHLNQGVYTPTIAESLGSDMGRLAVIKKDEDIPIQEIESIYGQIHHTKFDFETLKGQYPYSEKQLADLEDKFADFKRAREAFDEHKRITGVSDYSDLKGIAENRKNPDMTFNQIEFAISALYALIESGNFSGTWHTLDEVVSDVRRFQRSTEIVSHRIEESQTRKDYTLDKRVGRKIWSATKWLINKLVGLIPGLS